MTHSLQSGPDSLQLAIHSLQSATDSLQSEAMPEGSNRQDLAFHLLEVAA